MAITVQIHPELGYVLLVYLAIYMLNIWQALNVGKMRKKLKVFYPTMYSDKFPEFNCYQRVHQNTLENIPFLLATLPVAGIRHPLLATAFGLFWIFARVIYSFAYYSGDPRKRVPGAIMTYVAQWSINICLVSTVAGFLGWW